MRKVFIFSLIAMTIVFAAGCRKYDGGITLKYTTLTPIIDNTGADYEFTFSEGDEIWVNNSSKSGVSYIYTNEEGLFTCPNVKFLRNKVTWNAYYPSNSVDLTQQSGILEDIKRFYALLGSVESNTLKGLKIEMAPQVAILKIDNQKGALDIDVKDKDGNWVTGLQAKSEGAGFEIIYSSTKATVLNTTEKGTFYIVVPAEIQLTINDGDDTIDTTNGYEAGIYYNITISGETYDYVEIGGKKWATMNVGATTVAGSPATCYGDYFAWGETEPRYTGITITGKNSVSFSGWKWNYPEGYNEKVFPEYTEETLDAYHDAATQIWGSKWRTPTNADFEALMEACTGSTLETAPIVLNNSSPEGGVYWLSSDQELIEEYKGVAGILFVDKLDTSKRLFFPAAGNAFELYFNLGGSYGYYWSSSLYTNLTPYAYALRLHSSGVCPSNTYHRFSGRSVRPVSALD